MCLESLQDLKGDYDHTVSSDQFKFCFSFSCAAAQEQKDRAFFKVNAGIRAALHLTAFCVCVCVFECV